MWLINVYTMQLEHFPGHEMPIYAILSHTWAKEDEEVKFDELGAKQNSAWQHKSGGVKIKNMCQRTKELDIHYAWVDTCCIDNSSSTEVSEAINIMFRLYQDAAICFVHLQGTSMQEESDVTELLSQSKWFTRGWTLQELIAPQKVRFYDQNWSIIGDKSSDWMLGCLSKITRIYEKVLRDGNRMHDVSIGTRLSWAAGRQTSRVEDTAYSLLGICGVKMPIHYGEGPSAFRRLQREIIKSSNDTSILAWISLDCEEARDFLADSPDEFLLFSEANSFLEACNWTRRYTLTKEGWRIDAAPFGDLSDSTIDWDQMGKEHSKVTVNTYGVLIHQIGGIFVRTRLQKLVILNGILVNRSRVVHLKMHERTPYTTQICPIAPISDFYLEAYHIFDGFTYDGALRGQNDNLMDNIRLAELGDSHTTAQNVGSYPFKSAFFQEVHEPRTEITPCPDTSHFDSDNNIIASYADSHSISSRSEGDDISLPIPENLSWILDDLVDSSMRMFFQTLIQEIGCPWKVLHVDIMATNSKDVAEFTATLTTQCHLPDGRIECVRGIDLYNTYAWKKGHHVTSFSCHFYKKDPKRYEDCRLKGTSGISSLRRHILRKHRQPPYCPTCFKAFGLVSERDQHIVMRDCTPETSGHIEGISDHQASLIRKDGESRNEETRWYYLWNVIFPESQKPQSAYTDNSIDKLCLIFQSFWRAKGQLVSAFLLKQKGFLEWESLDEERNLDSVYSLILTDVTNKYLNFGTEIFVQLQASGLQNVSRNIKSSVELPEADKYAFADTRVVSTTAERCTGGAWIAKTPSAFVAYGSSTDSTEVTEHNWHTLKEWFVPNEVDDEFIGASSFSTENSDPNNGVRKTSILTTPAWSLPGDIENWDMMQTTVGNVGLLPCEFTETFSCGKRFELPNLDAWIDHHRYQHLGGMLPERCSCWYCDETFSGSDRSDNFIARMKHISEHFRADGRGKNQLRVDHQMTEHLEVLWPKLSVPKPELPRSAPSSEPSLIPRDRNSRGSKSSRRTLRGSRLSNDPFYRRLQEPRATRGLQEPRGRDTYDHGKRRSGSRR